MRSMNDKATVSLHDVYRLIAGHSDYHGDDILSALTCIAEGKEVSPIRPMDVVSAGAYEQVAWERDLAVQQLKDYGVGLGQAKDLAEVTRENTPACDAFESNREGKQNHEI